MFISGPGSWFLPIPNLESKNSNKKEGRKKILNYFIFEKLKEKSWAHFQNIIELFTQKIVTGLSNIWVRNPGSRKNLSRIQGTKKHRIPDPDPQHCIKLIIKILNFYTFSLKNQYHGKFLQFITVKNKGDFAHLSRKCGITSIRFKNEKIRLKTFNLLPLCQSRINRHKGLHKKISVFTLCSGAAWLTSAPMIIVGR